VPAIAAVSALSVALAGLGLDSLIEIGESRVVLGSCPGTSDRATEQLLGTGGFLVPSEAWHGNFRALATTVSGLAAGISPG